MKNRFQVISVVLMAIMLSGINAYAQGNDNIPSIPDTLNEFPNVVSVRGLLDNPGGDPIARFSCTGSLLHIDDNKVVILTAAHCTDVWAQYISLGLLTSVGVSFDLDNQQLASSLPNANGKFYIQGGVPISLPVKDAPFEKLDYGLVVFSRAATNSVGETFDLRWGSIVGALTPVVTAPEAPYVSNLIAGTQNPQQNLSFTAVGYGIGEALKGGAHDLSNFLIRHIASGLTYNAYNPGNDTLRLSMNANKNEGFTCNGDSGGPIFYQDPELGLVVVSVVSGGDTPCNATNTGPGFGRQEAFDFLSCGKSAGDAAAVKSCVDAIVIR